MLSRRTFLLALALALAAPARAEAQSLDALAAIALTRADGAPTTLGAELGPGPAIISFWSTTCAPCLPEARRLSRLRAEIAPERLNIVGINIDSPEDAAAIADFLARAGANYLQLRDGRPAYRAFTGGESVRLPRLYVFDAQGRRTALVAGYGEDAARALDRAVAELLGV
jgi:thiol-disulfide isomerase/thioredoxin